MTKLPATSEDWSQHYRHGRNIHEFETVESASKITEDQFFALKVIWPIHKRNELAEKWITLFGCPVAALHQKAQTMRTGNSAWKKYLDCLEENVTQPGKWKPGSTIPAEMGVYAIAFHNQLSCNYLPADGAPDAQKVYVTPMVTRSQARQQEGTPTHRPTKRRNIFNPANILRGKSPRTSEDIEPADTGNSPGSLFEPAERMLQDKPTEDEQIVNRALLNFLDAQNITEERNYDWEDTRKEFVFESPRSATGNAKPKDEATSKPKAILKKPKTKNKGKSKQEPRPEPKPEPKPARFVARTDGHLRVYGPPRRSAAILEVKARIRLQDREKDMAIEMQESAQMALWIFQEPASHWTAATTSTVLTRSKETVY